MKVRFLFVVLMLSGKRARLEDTLKSGRDLALHLSSSAKVDSTATTRELLS